MRWLEWLFPRRHKLQSAVNHTQHNLREAEYEYKYACSLLARASQKPQSMPGKIAAMKLINKTRHELRLAEKNALAALDALKESE